jgi:hypothetical protein
MNPEIEKLIDLAIADGQITEKERNVILKKAIELGADADEVEMMLDGKLHQLEASKQKQKEKVGNIKTCPACGAHVKSFEVNCNDCGHEFSGGDSLNILIKKLSDLPYPTRKGVFDFGWQAKTQNVAHQRAILIQNHEIKNTKQDLIEFLTYSEQFLGKSIEGGMNNFLKNPIKFYVNFVSSLDIESVSKNVETKAIKTKAKQIVSQSIVSFKEDKEMLDWILDFSSRNNIKVIS